MRGTAGNPAHSLPGLLILVAIGRPNESAPPKRAVSVLEMAGWPALAGNQVKLRREGETDLKFQGFLLGDPGGDLGVTAAAGGMWKA